MISLSTNCGLNDSIPRVKAVTRAAVENIWLLKRLMHYIAKAMYTRGIKEIHPYYISPIEIELL